MAWILLAEGSKPTGSQAYATPLANTLLKTVKLLCFRRILLVLTFLPLLSYLSRDNILQVCKMLLFFVFYQRAKCYYSLYFTSAQNVTILCILQVRKMLLFFVFYQCTKV